MEDAENNFFKKQNAKEGPLISVIIPCYNHELYLGQAIESALSQTFPNVEIIIVDDGSSDDSAKIAKSYHQVIYFFQENQGSSAARNTGIILSQGDYIVFLDADDYLLPEALQINYQYLKNTDAAFVFGTYRDQYEDKSTSPAEIIRVDGEKFYYHLLRYNYIGMISTVMFQKWIFECFKFDVRIRGHEDHDLYLQIARDHLIIQHTIVIAVYRRHPYNTSNNITMMSADALKVLKKQKRNLRSKKEKMVYILTYISLYQKFFATEFDSWPGHISVFRENRKSFYILKALFIFQRNLDKIKVMKTIIKNRMSNFIKNKLYKVRFFFSPKP
ncbi:MAG: glycosyltransferase family 2 protein [Fulvivirga sp.]